MKKIFYLNELYTPVLENGKLIKPYERSVF